MRFILAVSSVLGLVAASPCKPRSTITLVSSASSSAAETRSTETSVASTSISSSSVKPSTETTKVANSSSSSSAVPSSAVSSASTTPTTATSTSITVSTTTSVNNPATAAVTNPVALTYYDDNLADGTAGRNPPNSGYVCYAGPSANFPARSTWTNFNNMWNNAVTYALTPKGDSTAEIQDIYNAIISVSQISKVDARVILGVILIESTGNVRVGCTDNGVQNCGLMQAYNSSSYDPSNAAASIRQMVQDGTQGTVYGPGLVQLLNNSPLTTGTTGGDLWKTLRAYNSGKFDESNLSNGEGANPEYVSDIANYLQGWNGYGNGPAGCNFANPFDTLSPTA